MWVKSLSVESVTIQMTAIDPATEQYIMWSFVREVLSKNYISRVKPEPESKCRVSGQRYIFFGEFTEGSTSFFLSFTLRSMAAYRGLEDE